MRCENCKAEFTVKEQAKAKGCCPSCGEKLSADAYRDDAKARRWYRYHSPMPLNVILAYVYLVGGGELALMIAVESANLGLWTVADPAGWLSVITAALIFLLPFFDLFLMLSARRSMRTCKNCNSQFSLRKLAWKKGCCPSCGVKIPVSDYCSGVPDRRWWRLFRDAPLCLKISAISLALLGCVDVFDVLFPWPFIYVVFLIIFLHMMNAVMRGSIPYVSIMALGALGWGAEDSFHKSPVAFLLLAIFLLSFLMPASRRWGRKIREEDLACWIAAVSGAVPFRRMVAKSILKKTIKWVVLLVCLGLCVYTPEPIGRMRDWLWFHAYKVMSCLHSAVCR